MESGLWNTMLGRLLVVIYFGGINTLGCLFLLARMSKEDIALRNQFGKKWDDWAKNVPYSVFPGIY
jgi:protein-S-isoprenylcysteine O-methyltransferase Ste14